MYVVDVKDRSDDVKVENFVFLDDDYKIRDQMIHNVNCRLPFSRYRST